MSKNVSDASYAILTDDTRIDFELENTPMSNFEGDQTSVILNGTEYRKRYIKEITFGSSYGNVTSIGYLFLSNYPSLTSLDLSAFSSVTSISEYFLYTSPALTQFKISAVKVPTTRENGFLSYSTYALTTILVPMQSVQAYKTTSPWRYYASKIQGY